MEETGKLNDIVDEIKEKAAEIKENAPEKIQEMKEDVKEAYDKAAEKAKETVGQIKAEIDDYSAELDPEDVKNNKLMAVLAYIGPLVLIPLLLAKGSKFAKFHTNQGLILFLLGIACELLRYIPVIKIIGRVGGLALLVMAVVGIVYAIKGKAKELPIVGNWTLLK